MANYGIKVSRQGFDATTCSDNQLLFSSAFRSPLVIASGNVAISNVASNQTIYTHGLSYIPVAFPLVNGWWDSGVGFGTCDWDCSDIHDSKGIFIDSTKIWYRGGSWPSSKTVTYFVLGIDLETNLSAIDVDTSDDTQGTISNNYGFKMSKSGKDVLTASLSDLQVFSGDSSAGHPVRNQIIHSIGGQTNVADATLLTVAHGLGYKPMFLFYAKNASYGYLIEQVTFDVVGGAVVIKNHSYADNTNIYWRNDTGNAWDIRYVIFKDPMI